MVRTNKGDECDMAKLTKRLNIKGEIDIEKGTITEFDKELGEVEHSITDILTNFANVEDVTLTLSHDKIVEAQ